MVILLHGFPEFWRSWQHQIEPLAQAGFRVIVPDQRGYNLSDKPLPCSAYRLDRLGGDVLAILDQLGAQQAYLAGHDFGASVAWWLLTAHPERFAAAAILNVPHPLVLRRKLRTSLRQLGKSWYIAFFQLPSLPEWWFSHRNYELGVQSLLGSSRHGTFLPADLEAYRRAWSQPGSVRAMLQWYRAFVRYGFPLPLPNPGPIAVPVRILWGDEDRFLCREMAEESVAYCREASCRHFPGVSHWIQHEQPAVVARELIRHFSCPLT